MRRPSGQLAQGGQASRSKQASSGAAVATNKHERGRQAPHTQRSQAPRPMSLASASRQTQPGRGELTWLR
eukprot:566544-Hanusia_phi.AAC.1